MDNYEVIGWLILMIVLIAIELITVGLTTIWMAGGALVALLLAIPGTPLALQAGAFVAVSVLLMLFTRPAAVRLINSRTQRTNVDTLEGKTAVVSNTIDNRNSRGRVIINGMDWTARSMTGGIIETGEDVVIREVRGVTLIVEPAEDGKTVTE